MKRSHQKIAGALVGIVAIATLGLALRSAQRETAALHRSAEKTAVAVGTLKRAREMLRQAELPPERTPAASKHQPWHDALAQIRQERTAQPTPPLPPAPRYWRGGEIFPELLADPEYERLVLLYTRANIENQHADYFATTSASPATIARLKEVLVQHKFTELEKEEVAARNGIPAGRRGELSYMFQQQREAELRALLGEDEFAGFRQHEKTQNQRRLVDAYVVRMSYAEEPLQPEQAKALFAILASEQVESYNGQGRPTHKVPAQKFNEAVVERARAVLTPAQTEMLKRFQQERDKLEIP